jgi:hypothetical protein
LLLLAVLGCQYDVQTVARPSEPRRAAKPLSCSLTLHPPGYRFDPGCREIGDVYVADTGWTTECDLETARERIRLEGCAFGADAAQIVNDHEPTAFGSWCHQVRARFLVCEKALTP